jgi:two-component system chemotaxis sensor kinase CheA
LKAFYSGANVTIEVADDGRGLNATTIRQKAVDKGLIDGNASLTDREIFDLVFLPGFSTCEQVSEISGRGVGMDVVKKNIASIRGSVTIDSIPGKGTTISIHLPMVLSIIDGLLVSVGDNKFVFPLAVVERIFSLKKQDVEAVFNNVIALEGTQYPFFNLRDCFSVECELPGRMQAVLVNNSDGQALFSIDKVEGKIQAVLKPLGKFYQDNKFLSAATILADGSIALVLDSNAIIKEC